LSITRCVFFGLKYRNPCCFNKHPIVLETYSGQPFCIFHG
jgi:hypothetical protein